jgi:long-subunit fatty acid transport protein
MGWLSTPTSDYSLGLSVTVHYFITQKFSVGTGLGGQVLLLSLSRLPKNLAPSNGVIYANGYYRPFIPVLPVELSLKLRKVLFTIRYEYGLINRLKGDLGSYQKDKFALLTFEMGFRIR